MRKAIDAFHRKHPDAPRLLVDVQRHPYSWAGDDQSMPSHKITYAERMREQQQDDDARGRQDVQGAPRRIPLQELGDQTGVKFEFEGLEMKWHAVESQRLALWAAAQGKQEQLVHEIAKRHFERKQTCADRVHLLHAVKACGLDTALADAYLETSDNEDVVWKSYGNMMHVFGISAIPVFSFTLGMSPFDPRFRAGVGLQPMAVQGSATTDVFLHIFERLHAVAEELQVRRRESQAKL